jgi:hypothetical protein
MSKARVSWAFDELLTSAKHNQENTDYITPGLLLVSSTGGISDTNTAFGVTLGFYPYSPSKSVFNRMLVGGFTSSTPSHNLTFEYSLDSGATWTHADLTEAWPGGTPTHSGLPGFTTQEGPGCNIIDLSGIASFQYLGFKLTATNPGELTGYWWSLTAFMYRLDDGGFDHDPF